MTPAVTCLGTFKESAGCRCYKPPQPPSQPCCVSSQELPAPPSATVCEEAPSPDPFPEEGTPRNTVAPEPTRLALGHALLLRRAAAEHRAVDDLDAVHDVGHERVVAAHTEDAGREPCDSRGSVSPEPSTTPEKEDEPARIDDSDAMALGAEVGGKWEKAPCVPWAACENGRTLRPRAGGRGRLGGETAAPHLVLAPASDPVARSARATWQVFSRDVHGGQVHD